MILLILRPFIFSMVYVPMIFSMVYVIMILWILVCLGISYLSLLLLFALQLPHASVGGPMRMGAPAAVWEEQLPTIMLTKTNGIPCVTTVQVTATMPAPATASRVTHCHKTG